MLMLFLIVVLIANMISISNSNTHTNTPFLSHVTNMQISSSSSSSSSSLLLSSSFIKPIQPAYDKTKYPDIFILGEQKCGTTSLNTLLEYHSKLCNKGVKEKHFFGDRNFSFDYSEYDNKFEGCKRHQLTLDSTPEYIFYNETAMRVYSSYSSLSLSLKKFIVLFREPVSRDYSEYQRTLRICFLAIEDADKLHKEGNKYDRHSGVESRIENSYRKCSSIIKNFNTNNSSSSNATMFTKDDAYTYAEWSSSPHGLLQKDRGLYLYQLKQWLTYINRNQLIIISFDTLLTNTTDTVKRLASFLNIDYKPFTNTRGNVKLPPPPPSNHYVSWPGAYFDCSTYDIKEQYYSYHNKGLIEFINNGNSSSSSNSNYRKPYQEPPFPYFKSSRYKCTSGPS